MTFIDQLERAATAETGYFRAFLMREDVARLRQLQRLAASTDNAAAFVKSGMALGWTQGDLRTSELSPTLTAFLEAFLAAAKAGNPDSDDAKLETAWRAFDADRMERLVGCLSRAPKPDLA